MKEAFAVAIKPLNDKLAADLGIKIMNEEDFTVIPVNVRFPNGTTQTVENGLVVECDHAGAEFGMVPEHYLSYNPHTSDVEMVDTCIEARICDKCNAWQDEEGFWNE